MEINLINPAKLRPTMEKFCFAYEVCYERDVTWDTRAMKDVDIEVMEKYLDKRISEGHMNGLETETLSFFIKDISRVASHQIVRHRHATISQLSQRFSAENKLTSIVPSSIMTKLKGDEEIKAKYEAHIESLRMLTIALSQAKVPHEDYRYVLPQSQATNMLFTANFHALLKIMRIRLCTLTQQEFRTAIVKMKKLVAKHFPFMKKHMLIKCQVTGFCDETKNYNNAICQVKPYKKPNYLELPV